MIYLLTSYIQLLTSLLLFWLYVLSEKQQQQKKHNFVTSKIKFWFEFAKYSALIKESKYKWFFRPVIFIWLSSANNIIHRVKMAWFLHHLLLQWSLNTVCLKSLELSLHYMAAKPLYSQMKIKEYHQERGRWLCEYVEWDRNKAVP